ncbi:cytochrome b [Rhizobium mesoamericanum]|uniref:Putative cytochrome B561 protein n=1 Tax=Rhizobium mesoamericanum STM3625 TaxID=1211777 RepID=K0PUZ8_9HYPH|nr:cytochrome b/b6 domain-containing protein [Rhizobium mesoamericanum]CCM77588.1 putative cytochrome B561 protein [Rhizobium mesoamericanum STM3625]
MPTDSRDAYSLPQRLLHWVMAVAIFFNLLFPDGMNAWNRTIRHGGVPSADQIASANVHAYVGIGILVLAILRVSLRLIQGAPAEPAVGPKTVRIGAKVAHAALYLLIFLLPLTGMAAYYLGIDISGELHGGILKAILWAFIAAHVAGALAHQFYWKTNVLRRMTVGG